MQKNDYRQNVSYLYDNNGLQQAKKDFRTFAKSVVSDQPAQSAQADLRRHFMTSLDFVLK